MMRLAYYASASTAAAVGCLLKAFHQRPNFYSATVYLSESNACLLILTNLLLILACSFIYALQRLLYGPLRPIEVEQLSEKAWYAVLDTLLAMPTFREDVGGWLLTMFVLLLSGKVWGWIGEGRVDILEQQPPANPKLFHIRLATSLVLSVVFDLTMLDYCIESVLADPRPGMMVIFTFEFAILSVFSIFTFSRYILGLIEASVVKVQTKEAIEMRKHEIRAERAAARNNEPVDNAQAAGSPPEDEPIEVDENEVDVPGWEEKRRYLFFLEVCTDFIKLTIYIFFFAVSITFNGLPMHIMRDVYMTFASFSKRVSDYVAYRKATSDMNSRYPDATTEEIRGDSCIVCRESMVTWEQPNAENQALPAAEQPAAAPAPARRRDEGLRAKKLPCGHILHLRCLKAWLERQQVCPTCRRPVVTAATPDAQGPAGGNQAAQGQQGQQGQQQPPRRRQNRARIFNLGPIRVGLLNAHNNQLQNIVDQIRNMDGGNNNNNNAAAALNQPAADDSGGQVPIAEQQGASSTVTRSLSNLPNNRNTVPLQIQLMQMEQRIVQEAHNLTVDQQQLNMLRMMEAELARLRALHVHIQPSDGIPQTTPNPGLTSAQPTGPNQSPLHLLPPPETVHGDYSQQFVSGTENLPEGLRLPEGWSIMPLYRVGGDMPAPGTALAAPEDHSTPLPSFQNGAQASSNAVQAMQMDHTTAPTESANGMAPTSGWHPNQDAGPTDGGGSPLFVPAPNPASTVDRSSSPTRTSANDETQAQSSQDSKTSWARGDWSFDDEGTASREPGPSSSNGAAPESTQQNSTGNGKGKAVQVEEAPDEDM